MCASPWRHQAGGLAVIPQMPPSWPKYSRFSCLPARYARIQTAIRRSSNAGPPATWRRIIALRATNSERLGWPACLLAVVPDIGRELPILSDLLPHDHILPGDFF